MEAKLPDVNAGIVTHRKAVMNAYDKGDYIKCAISFDGIIALLPEDYKPDINTQLFQDTVRGRHFIQCDVCEMPELDEKEKPTGRMIPREFKRSEITPFELLLSSEDSCIMGMRKCIAWSCPECGNTRPLTGSKTRNEEYMQPYYTGIIPEMPRRQGLHDRIGYSRRFKEWYQIAFREIEYKIGLYRAEYQRQNPDEALPMFDHDE